MNRIRHIWMDIWGVFSTNIVSGLIQFLVGIVIYRELGPKGAGVYAAITAIPTMFFFLTRMGIAPATVLIRGQKRFTDDELLSALMRLVFVTSAFSIVLFTGIYLLLDNPDFRIELIMLILLLVPFRIILNYSKSIFLARQKINVFNRLKWVNSIVYLLTVILFVYFLKAFVFGALLSLLLSNIITALICLYLLRKDFPIKWKVSNKVIWALIGNGILYGLSVFVINLNYRVDIIMMERMSTFRQLGLYALGVNVAELIWQVPGAVRLVVLTRSANAGDQAKMAEQVLRILRLTMILGFFVCIALYFIVPYVIPLLYGDRFDNAIIIARYMLPGIWIFIGFKILNSHLSGMGKPHYALYLFVPALLLNILLNVFWIPAYGAIGAAWASNVSYSLGAIGMIIMYSILMKISVFSMLVPKRSDFQINFKEIFWRLKKKGGGS